ncbi:hypothetical protein KXR83_17535 [Williamsia muralis]|uniref:hypothetical protein n=1 Tax=Williamsia marianensis TaxID=85044 RepID=UPI003F16F5A3
MTAVYFLIAALALAGALALLWLDRKRTTGVRRERAVWGDQHGFKYRDSDPALKSEFGRAAMDVPDHIEVQDLAYGSYYGEETVVFDLAETATIVAIRRTTESNVTIDLRHEKTLAPAEDDVELLGAMGKRVMFSSHLDVARRVCDRRMVALATNAPDYIQILWNEGAWSLGSMPITNDPERLDVALETVRRFTDLLRVLPPVVDPQSTPDPRDPSSPTGRARRGLADPRTENIRREDLPRPQRNPGPRTESGAHAREAGPTRRTEGSGPMTRSAGPVTRGPVPPVRTSGPIPRQPGPPGSPRPGGPQ